MSALYSSGEGLYTFLTETSDYEFRVTNRYNQLTYWDTSKGIFS